MRKTAILVMMSVSIALAGCGGRSSGDDYRGPSADDMPYEYRVFNPLMISLLGVTGILSMLCGGYVMLVRAERRHCRRDN